MLEAGRSPNYWHNRKLIVAKSDAFGGSDKAWSFSLVMARICDEVLRSLDPTTRSQGEAPGTHPADR